MNGLGGRWLDGRRSEGAGDVRQHHGDWLVQCCQESL